MGINLVTGGCGFVGSHLANELVRNGQPVRVMDLDNADTSFLDKTVEFVAADLTRPETLPPALKHVETIFHAASIYDISLPEEKLNQVNVDGTRNLCQAAVDNGVKQIFSFSSYSVYGKSEKEDYKYIDETHPKNPITAYGKSRFQQDSVIMEFGHKGLSWTILRPSIPYGPRNFYGAFHVFKIIESLPIVPIPKYMKNRVDFIHVSDIVNATMHVSRLPNHQGQEYNLTDSSNYTAPKIMELLADLFDKPKFPVYFPSFLSPIFVEVAGVLEQVWKDLFKGRPCFNMDAIANSLTDLPFSNEKMLKTGYTFLYPNPKEGMADTIQWYRQHGYMA